MRELQKRPNFNRRSAMAITPLEIPHVISVEMVRIKIIQEALATGKSYRECMDMMNDPEFTAKVEERLKLELEQEKC